MSAKPSIRKRANSVENNRLLITNVENENNISNGYHYSSEFEDSSGGSEVDEILTNGTNDCEIIDLVSSCVIQL